MRCCAASLPNTITNFLSSLLWSVSKRFQDKTTMYWTWTLESYDDVECASPPQKTVMKGYNDEDVSSH